MNILENAIRALGFEPAQLQQIMGSIVNDAATVKREVVAAKGGFQAAVAHFDERIARLELMCSAICAKLEIELPAADPPALPAPSPAQPNGADRHDQAE